ncbi:MAG: MFS transporter [Candidatus Omnitrophota bacterium]|nr:MFS transporter [Candidatus Omnitrophota bacterium]
MSKIRKSLRFSFLDGVFASCMSGLTTDYISPYALTLNATNSQIGFLSAIPNISSSLAQLGSADLAEKLKSRKRVIKLFVFLHTLMALPIIFLPYLFKTHQAIFLIIFVTLFTSLNAFAIPVWASLLADYVPFKSRGKYFGWRNKALGIVTILSAFLAGGILYLFRYNVLKGFLIIFSLAFVCRSISWYFLTRMYEPVFKVKKEVYFSFFDFIKRARESNFVKFVVFVALLNFCVNLTAPFFSVFMLKDLKFSYLTYTFVVTTVLIFQIFSFNRWGVHADRVGNVKVLKFTSLIIASLPFFWIINQNPIYFVFIQAIAGFAWAGFNLCATNFIYDAINSEKRMRCIAYFSACVGMASCLGALSGGYLVNALPVFLGYKILSLFLVSGILRFFVVFLLSQRIREVRKVYKISSRDLFYSVAGIKLASGITQEPRQVLD